MYMVDSGTAFRKRGRKKEKKYKKRDNQKAHLIFSNNKKAHCDLPWHRHIQAAGPLS